jgi:AcrR family transcriptional regulator
MTSPDTRTRILDSAVELIARDGYDGVRLAEIAKHAGASTALLHYHFANRAQLLAAAISHSLDRERSRAERRAHAQERSSPAERVADQIDFWLPISPDDVREWLLWSELEGRAVRDQDLAKALTDLYTRLRAPLVEAIADGVATGDFGPCDPEESAAVAHALLGGMTDASDWTRSVASRSSPRTNTSVSTEATSGSSSSTAETLWNAPTTRLCGSRPAACSVAEPSSTCSG